MRRALGWFFMFCRVFLRTTLVDCSRGLTSNRSTLSDSLTGSADSTNTTVPSSAGSWSWGSLLQRATTEIVGKVRHCACCVLCSRFFSPHYVTIWFIFTFVIPGVQYTMIQFVLVFFSAMFTGGDTFFLQSAAMVEFMKRDLTEFSETMQKDTTIIMNDATQAVKEKITVRLFHVLDWFLHSCFMQCLNDRLID